MSLDKRLLGFAIVRLYAFPNWYDLLSNDQREVWLRYRHKGVDLVWLQVVEVRVLEQPVDLIAGRLQPQSGTQQSLFVW